MKSAEKEVWWFTCLKWSWLAILAAAFYGPLLAPAVYPGLFAFKILFALHLPVFGVLFIFKRGSFRIASRTRPYLVFFALWLGWAVISLLWCDNRVDGAMNVYYLFTGLALVSFTALYFRSENDLKVLLAVLVLVYISLLAVGIWEYKTGQHLKTAGEFIDNKSYFTPRGVFKNPNDFATCLVLYLPFLYVSARYCLNRLRTAPLAVVPAAAIGIGIFLVVNSGSRANLLALPLMGVAALAVCLVQGRWKALLKIIAVMAVFVVSFVILASSNPQVNYWVNRQVRIARHHLSSLEHVGGEQSARMVLLANGLTELDSHRLMGVGAGNAEDHMKKYLSDDFKLLALHNWWLEVLVNYGVFIFILFMAFYLKLLGALFTIAVRAGPGTVRILAEGALLALIGFSIASVSSSSLIYARFMWIVFGLALCAVNAYYRGLSPGDRGERR